MEFSPDNHPFQKYLSQHGHHDKIYEALVKDDPSEAVITYINSLDKCVDQKLELEVKSDRMADIFRSEGNQFYKAQKYRQALECYNRALLYAPENSRAMKLAYSNRSALLFTTKAYKACISDIDTFFSMGCTDYNISQRLKQRKQEALQNVFLENIKTFSGRFADNYLKFDVKRNPQIPCTSTDVDVVIESGISKIIAARDIPIGRLVAVESPFVSELDQENFNVSCYYCHRLSLNLIPCDGCCVALFCDEICKTKCKKEYHSIECKITSKPKSEMAIGSASAMKLKAAIKIKQMCKSWKEFIEASYNLGEDRMRSSSSSDIYDVRSKFSLLCFNSQSHFIYGEKCNQSLMCGMDIRLLMSLDSFFPKEKKERDAAVRAFARVMMHLYTSNRRIEIYNAASDTSLGIFTSNTVHNFGWFSFTSKLKHSCNANLLILGIKNQIALVAIRPIKKGDEVTISFM